LYQKFVDIIFDVSFLKLFSNTFDVTFRIFYISIKLLLLLLLLPLLLLLLLLQYCTVLYWQCLCCNFGYTTLLV